MGGGGGVGILVHFYVSCLFMRSCKLTLPTKYTEKLKKKKKKAHTQKKILHECSPISLHWTLFSLGVCPPPPPPVSYAYVCEKGCQFGE